MSHSLRYIQFKAVEVRETPMVLISLVPLQRSLSAMQG